MTQQLTNPTSIMRMWVPSLASLGGLKSSVAVSCGVGRRYSSYSELLWLWCRPAAVALIQPLAWEPPYAAGAALEKAKRQIIIIIIIIFWSSHCGSEA